MKRHSRIAVAAFFLAGLPAVPGSAADSGTAQVTSLITKEIRVKSNGSSYHQLPPLSNVVADVRVDLDTGTAGRIVWFTTWLSLGTETFNGHYWYPYRESGYHKSFGDDRPRSWSGTLVVSVPGEKFGPLVKTQCNGLADRLRADGLSDTAIFAEDRVIELGVHAGLDYEMTGPSGNALVEGSNAPDQTLRLVCEKWPGMVAPQVADTLDSLPPTVKSASLTLLERSGPTGVCKIILSGVIQTSMPDIEVSFRYKDKAGHESEVYSVTTDHAKTAMFSHEYKVDNNPDGGESGSVRIFGTSHDFKSAWAAYDMDCVEPGTSDYQTVLAPTVEMQVVELEKVMVGRQLCVSRLKLYGKITGRGPMSGVAAFVGDAYVSAPQPYAVEQGEIVLFGAERELDWTTDPQTFEAASPSPASQPKSQTIQLGLNVTGTNNTVIASVPKKPYSFTCVFPTLRPDVMGGGGGLTVEPRQPAGAVAAMAAPPAAPLAGQAGGPRAALAVLPDLKIQQAEPGQHPSRLRVRVVNGGAGAAGATKLKAVYRRDGKNVVRSVAVQPLAAGAAAVMVVDFGLPVRDARRIGLQIDEPDQIKEQNEGNNTLQFNG